jgi:HEAT repeat protein
MARHVHNGRVELHPDALFLAARAEIATGDGSGNLVALHARPTREVFATAARLLHGADPLDRELGARVLRELGPPGRDGRRPFAAEAIPLLVARLHAEPEPGVLRWVISALDHNAAREALPAVLPFASHADDEIRFGVAAALPGLVDPDEPEPGALAALRALCLDADADTRWYALYALVEEGLGGADNGLLRLLLEDPDELVRDLARKHLPARDGR